MEIPKESNPDIDIPIIYVSMSLDGVSPEDAERLMVRPMEEELRGIEGIKEMTATAYEGGANVVLEFDAGFDPDQAESDVRVAVDYSTINYKDGLAITGAAPVVRTYPMVPGIDFAGTVAESQNAEFRVGDAVVLNGWGVGEGHWGGLAQQARVKGDWLIKRPAAFSARQAMASEAD